MTEPVDARVAVYIDFDNIVISRYDQVHGRSQFMRDKSRGLWAAGTKHDADDLDKLKRATVDIGAVIDFASSFGTLVLTRAYADWSATVNADYRGQLVARAVDLVQLFPAAAYAKNGADIRLAVDAIEDMFRLPDLTHVVIVGGDSDYIALAQRCKRLGRYVVGIGVAGSTSRSLSAACDEFATYDALPGVKPIAPAAPKAQAPHAATTDLGEAGDARDDTTTSPTTAADRPAGGSSRRRGGRGGSGRGGRTGDRGAQTTEPTVDETSKPSVPTVTVLFDDGGLSAAQAARNDDFRFDFDIEDDDDLDLFSATDDDDDEDEPADEADDRRDAGARVSEASDAPRRSRVSRRAQSSGFVVRNDSDDDSDSDGDSDGDGEDPQLLATNLLERALRLGHEKDDTEWLHSSNVKTQMKRMDPSFSEKALGYRSFSDFIKSRDEVVELDESSTARLVRLSPDLQ